LKRKPVRILLLVLYTVNYSTKQLESDKLLVSQITKAPRGRRITQRNTYLVVEHEVFFLILLVITFHTHLFTIARAQRISSSLSFDASRVSCFCPMRTASPQSITEKNIAGTIIIVLRVTGRSGGHREQMANAKIRFVGHRRRMFQTRVVRARDATRRGCRDRLILGETT